MDFLTLFIYCDTMFVFPALPQCWTVNSIPMQLLSASACLITVLIREPACINKPQCRHPFPAVLVASELPNDPESPGHVHWRNGEGWRGRREQGRFEVGHPQEPGHGLGQLASQKSEWEGSKGAVQVSARPPPAERCHVPPPDTVATQKSWLGGEWVARLVLTAGKSGRGRGRHLHGLGCAEQAAVVPSPDPPGCPRAGRLSTASRLGRQSGVAMTWMK